MTNAYFLQRCLALDVARSSVCHIYYLKEKVFVPTDIGSIATMKQSEFSKFAFILF